MPTRPRVLLVDDHPGVAKAIGRALAPECDVVGVVADGREVADAAARLQPVVIVVEWDPLESTCRHASLSIL